MRGMPVLILTLLLGSLPAPAQDPPMLQIEVRDATGEPCGDVPVVIVATRQPRVYTPAPERAWGEKGEVVWRGRTDAEGRIVRSVESIRKEVGRWVEWRMGPRYDDDAVQVALDVPMADPVGHRVLLGKMRAGARRIVKMVLPETAPVEVTVDPWNGLLPDSLVAQARYATARGTAVAEAPVVDGKATFTHVAVGASFELTVRDEDRNHDFAPAVRMQGPGEADVALKTRIGCGPPYPVLEGRLVGEEGAPAPDSYAWWITDGDRFVGSGHVVVDPDGSFRIVLRKPMTPGLSPRLELFPDTPSWGSIRILPPPETKAYAKLADWPLAAGANRLGVVVLKRVPVLVSGRVVDSAGRPVSRAKVEASALRAGTKHPRLNQVETDAAGRFVIHFETANLEGVVKVKVKVGGHAQNELEVAPGTTDLTIALGDAGTVRGTFRVTRGEGVPIVQVRAMKNGRSVGNPVWFMDKDGDEVRFRIDDVPAGKVDIHLSVPGRKEPVVIEDVIVRTGESVSPEKLSGLDLR